MQEIKLALGFIETIGLVAAIAAADAALKAADVSLIGRENSQGGMMTVKIAGNVSAVKAALSAAKAVSERVNRVWSIDVIPRPGQGIGGMLTYNKATLGSQEWLNLMLSSKALEQKGPMVGEGKPEKNMDQEEAQKNRTKKRAPRKRYKRISEKDDQDVIMDEEEGGMTYDSGSPGDD
ncbi:BMC domain-containing protein [Acetomicrobium flavidum]|uniref:BMC domain-containing protein n=1 Tax=Acetomicrobium flavidum TaxID=49896 RepID=A0ABY1JD08_9BACT|nr:BMC domain-containing protein [Acetomicrobium flavidum]